MILRKSIKSIQLTLNEVISIFPDRITSVSAAAYTKARKKLRHTAFIELNQKAVVDVTYAKHHLTYRGHRLLAIDGSKIALPDTPENKRVFGIGSYANQKKHVQGSHALAMASVLYDVLNHIAVHALLTRTDIAEIDVMKDHLSYMQKGDIVVCDRGYCAFSTMAHIASTNADFVIRCPRRSFAIVRQMFQGEGPDSVTVHLQAPKGMQDVPQELAVRFIRALLPTGEVEILATSLLDEQEYPTKEFLQLYWHRWKIETFFGTIKTRLALENFTGISSETIQQDFFATVFLSGLESLLTEDVDTKLKRKEVLHPQQVNKAVAFHAIKYKAFDILLGTKSPQSIVEELTTLFLTNPTLYRVDKKPERRQSVTRRIVNYFRQKRKIVF